MDKNRSHRANNKNSTVTFALPGTPNGRKPFRPSASGSQHSTRHVQPRIYLTTPDKHDHFRMASDEREPQEYDSDDALDNDEEAGLNSEERKKRAQQKSKTYSAQIRKRHWHIDS